MQIEWRGVPIYNVVGGKMHFTHRQMLQVFSHPLSIFFLVMTAATLVLFDVHGYREHMSLSGTVLLLGVCIATLVGFYMAIFGLLMVLSKRFTWVMIYVPVVGAVAMSLNTVVTMYIASMLTEFPFVIADAIDRLPLNIAGGLIFESLFSIFTLPMVVGKTAPVDVVEAPHSPQITLGGQSFDGGTISSISSQDHYLEIKHNGGKVLLRARLADALLQLTHVEGISPHRSHWASRAAVVDLSGNSTQKVLRLVDGTVVPVARNRVAAVREWLEKSPGTRS